MPPLKRNHSPNQTDHLSVGNPSGLKLNNHARLKNATNRHELIALCLYYYIRRETRDLTLAGEMETRLCLD